MPGHLEDQSPGGRRVLVTGGAGFIGFHTVEEFLRRGWVVRAMTHRKPLPAPDDAEWAERLIEVKADITDADSLRRAFDSNGPFDAVVHCAARASDVGWRAAFRKANYDSVRYLGDLVMRHDVGRFVFVSTTDVYGMRDFHGETEDELDFDPRPRNPYPKYKILAEKWIAANLPKDRYSIVRPAAVWGDDDPSMTKRVRDFLKWSPYIVHFGKWKGGNRWPKVHVDTVATANYLAATLPEAAGEAFHVLDEEWTSVDAFYRFVAERFFPNRRFKTITLPLWTGICFGAVVTAIANLLNQKEPVTDPSLYALRVVSSSLDFSGEKFRRLAELDEGE